MKKLLAIFSLCLAFALSSVPVAFAAIGDLCPSATKDEAKKKKGAKLDAYQKKYKKFMDNKVKDLLDGEDTLDDVKKFADCVKYMQGLKKKPKSAIVEGEQAPGEGL